MVEVKLLIFDLIFWFVLINLAHICVCQQGFTFRLHSQQIDTVDLAIRLSNVVEVQLESLFGELVRTRQRYILFYAGLLPKDRHTAADLHMGNQLGWRDHNLLLFALIANKAEIVDSSGVVACACPVVYPPRNQTDLDGLALHLAHYLPEETLDQRSEPLAIDPLADKVPVQVQVPEVAAICRDILERVFAAFLHPLDAPLPRCSQVPSIAEVKAVLQKAAHCVDRLQRVWLLQVRFALNTRVRLELVTFRGSIFTWDTLWIFAVLIYPTCWCCEITAR